MHKDLDLLRTFHAVRQRSSLTRAASDLHVTQSAVSRRIAQLEERLGVRLFDRIGKALHVTDAGHALAREVPRVLGAVDRCVESVKAHATPGQGRLRIGASTTPGLYLLPALVGRFHRRYPAVEISYVVDNSAAVAQRLLLNELDLAVVGEDVSHPDLRSEVVAMDEIVCYAAPSHPLARRRRVAPCDLERETCVVRESGSATRLLFDAWIGAAGARLGRTIELSCPETIKALVAGGLGISYSSVHGIRRELARGTLRRLRISGSRLRRPIRLVYHGEKLFAPPASALVGLLRTAWRTDRRLTPRRSPDR